MQTRAEAAVRESEERFQQFAKASDSASGSETLTHQANAGGLLRGVLENETGAQAYSENQYELTLPDLMLSPAVEVLTLAFPRVIDQRTEIWGLVRQPRQDQSNLADVREAEKAWIAID